MKWRLKWLIGGIGVLLVGLLGLFTLQQLPLANLPAPTATPAMPWWSAVPGAVSSGNVVAPTPTFPADHGDKVLPAPGVFFGLAKAADGVPLNGAPPFTVDLRATARWNPASDLVRACQSVTWDWDDGTSDAMPCTLAADPATSSLLLALHDYSGQHTYTGPGIYNPHLRVLWTSGAPPTLSEPQSVIVAPVRAESWTAGGLRWGLWVLSLGLVGALFWWLWRRKAWGKWRRRLGYVLVGLVLITFVPPFSYLPNPGALVWFLVTHTYSYDPRLPFVNHFIIGGDPTIPIARTFDGLQGQTGLDPLDTTQPLDHYEFLQVMVPRYERTIQVTTRLTYANGSQRTYDLPVYQTNYGFYRGWTYDGLGRLRTEHRELAGLPFASATSSFHLGVPQRLAVASLAQALNPLASYSYNATAGPDRPIWSPQEDAFLAVQATDDAHRDLWLVPLDGGAPTRLAPNVTDYSWSPDGQAVVYGQGGSGAVFVVNRTGQDRRELARPDIAVLPGLSSEGAWYVQGGALWVAPLDGSPARRLPALPAGGATLVRPAPDGQRLAYACSAGLCLQDRDGGAATAIAVHSPALAWNPGGTHLAAVAWDSSQGWPRSATLTLLTRDGMVLRQVPLTSDGPVDLPQWLPDGRHLLVQAYPYSGRRIVLVDTDSGQALDLTQPRWDSWFALAPDGKSVLLTNGRGGFWRSDLLVNTAQIVP